MKSTPFSYSIIVLIGVLAVALLLYTFMAHDGQSMLKDKLMSIIKGMVAGKALEGQIDGGFLHNHSLDSFKGQFKDGNIAR